MDPDPDSDPEPEHRLKLNIFLCFAGRAAGIAGGPGPRHGGPELGRIHRLPRV